MRPYQPRRFAVAATTVLAVALLAACEGDNDHTSSAGSHSGSATPAVSAPASAAFNAADVAFATDMIPHHQQALEMAEVAETRASNPQVKDVAARIRQAQDPEIATMSGWLREWGQPVPSSSPGMGHGEHSGMPGMMSDQEMSHLAAASGADFDRMFLEMMIRHHQGAIDMAAKEQEQGQHPDAKKLAEKIAADQAAEITEMEGLLSEL